MSSRSEPVKVSETDRPESNSPVPVEVFQTQERRDEEQILAEMRGESESVRDLVYSATIGNRRVTNLSYAGVKEAVRRRGNVEILDVHVEETEKEFRALVKVRDHDNKLDVLGASMSDKSQPFAYTLAVNKAERNAFAKLIPAKWLATLVDEYLQRQSGRSVSIEAPEEKWEPQVPVTKDVLSLPGVRQFPLTEGTLAIGMLNVLDDGSELSLVPERPVPFETPPINWLVSKVLEAMKAKHPGFDYYLDADKDALRSILVRGRLEDAQVKELQHAAKWAFQHASAPQRQSN